MVAELDTNKGLSDSVDIALYDSFAQPESDHHEISVLVNSARARRVVVYTWNFHPDLIESAQTPGRPRLPVQGATGSGAGGGPGSRACRGEGDQRHQRAGPARPAGSTGPVAAKG